MSRAISRLTPSKPERMTAPGVSSTMKSMPVSISRARMLRPSRPITRPLRSSLWSATVETVVSTAWPPASRCMQVARMLRARRSASRRASSSTWRTSRALSRAQLVLELAQEDLARLGGAQAGDSLELADVLALGGLQLLALVLEVAGAIGERALLAGLVLEADVERLLLAEQPLLDAADLGAALAQLVRGRFA